MSVCLCVCVCKLRLKCVVVCMCFFVVCVLESDLHMMHHVRRERHGAAVSQELI